MAQPCPASHVEDHLPAADREGLDDCLAVALKGARLPIVGTGMLPVSQLPLQPPGRLKHSQPGIGRFAHDYSPRLSMGRPFPVSYSRASHLPVIYRALRPGKCDNRQRLWISALIGAVEPDDD